MEKDNKNKPDNKNNQNTHDNNNMMDMYAFETIDITVCLY